jgi:hypothetical protein
LLQIRQPRDDDWQAIARLASDEVQEGDHSGGIDGDWIENRRSVECERKDAVLESNDSIVGYCAIERQYADRVRSYRVFLVTDWSHVDPEVPDALLSHVEVLLVEVGAESAWMREVADDRELARFVTSRGFTVSAPYAFAGKQLVTFAKDCVT